MLALQNGYTPRRKYKYNKLAANGINSEQWESGKIVFSAPIFKTNRIRAPNPQTVPELFGNSPDTEEEIINKRPKTFESDLMKYLRRSIFISHDTLK